MESHFRDYIRTSSWNIKAKISDDNSHWFDIQVPNISASGLLLMTDKLFTDGAEAWIKLEIAPVVVGPDFLVKMRVKAAIKGCREDRDGLHCYAAKFTQIEQGDQIRLDELVRLTVSTYGSFD